MRRWCVICRWISFPVGSRKIPVCSQCWRDPIAGLATRRKRGEDPDLDAEEAAQKATP